MLAGMVNKEMKYASKLDKVLWNNVTNWLASNASWNGK